MGLRRSYTLFLRKYPSGSQIWWYRVYESPESQKRLEFSTGETSKTKARNFCDGKLKDGTLVPKVDPVPTFAEYTQDWWTDACPYNASLVRRKRSLARGTMALNRSNLDRYLIPAFGTMRLDEITSGKVERWLFAGPEVWGSCGDTGRNRVLQSLRTILSEAERLDILSRNPIRGKVKDLKEERKVRDLFTQAEWVALFSPEVVSTVWAGEWAYYMASLLMLSRGLRTGEVIGLHRTDLYEVSGKFFLEINKSWDRVEIKKPKTYKDRSLPIPEVLWRNLVTHGSKEGFLFSEDGGRSPLSPYVLPKRLVKAIGHSGIEEEARKKRGLTAQALRHLFNTTARVNNVPDPVTQSAMGHSSGGMTDHYTHINKEDLQVFNDLFVEIMPKEATLA